MIIPWEHHVTWFTGRNGLFKSQGIEIRTTSENDIAISPITSKGKIGHCDIVIERQSIPELINKLQSIEI